MILFLTKNVFSKPARLHLIFENACSKTLNILSEGPREPVSITFFTHFNFQHLTFYILKISLVTEKLIYMNVW